MAQQRLELYLSSNVCKQLRAGAETLGASEAELASIDRLETFKGTEIDVDRLAPLAMALGIPWEGLWRRRPDNG